MNSINLLIFVIEGLLQRVEENKNVLYDLASAYFSIFVFKKDTFDPKEILSRSKENISQSTELIKLKSLFKENEDLFNDSNELVKIIKTFTESYDKVICIESLFPCLLLFFLRIFDIYDSATQGLTIEKLIEQIETAKKSKQHPSEKEAIQSALGDKLLSQFGLKSFWQARYNNITSDTKPYDWYTTWRSIRGIILQKTNISKVENPLNVLEIGSGNSALASDMLQDDDLNIKQIISIDFVQDVIDAQNEITELRDLQDKLKYECVDAVDLSKYNEEQFDLVIDKGCLDSIMSTKTAHEDFYKTCKGISRVLKTGGYYVIVSCAISYDRLIPFKRPYDFKWRVTHLIELPSESNQDIKIYLIIIKKITEEEIEEEVKKASQQQ